MNEVNVRKLFSKLNAYCMNSMQSSAGMCVSNGNYEVTIDHLLYKLLDNLESEIALILEANEIEISRLSRQILKSIEHQKTGNSSKPSFSRQLIELFEESWMFCSLELEEYKISSGIILLTLLRKRSLSAELDYYELLSSLSSDRIVKDFSEISLKSIELEKEKRFVQEQRGKSHTEDFIGKYCRDITKEAETGKIDAVFGRDMEIQQLVNILARRRKNNPICVGEPGVGKTAVIEGLALKIVEDDVPEVISGVRLLELDMGLLEAGAGIKGEFENRLKGVITEIKSSEQPIILFIDEAHTLIGSGGAAGQNDAANLLKPALARGELRTIAATTWSEYKKYFEKDPALARRFQLVKLDEPTVETTSLILRGIKDSYEKSHNVMITDEACIAAAEMAKKYISGRFLPDKAIDLIDTACARTKISQKTLPYELDRIKKEMMANERTIAAMQRDYECGVSESEEEIIMIKAKQQELQLDYNQKEELWLKEKELAEKLFAITRDETLDGEQKKSKTLDLRKLISDIQQNNPLVNIEVNRDTIAQVISDWTGIPVGKLQREEAGTVLHLKDKLSELIIGQDDALELISKGLIAAKSGIRNPEKPLGIFLLAGPSGVGKTETGLCVADIMFGSRDNVVNVNMSEFQERHHISRLIGSPPGYVGYGEGGKLTEAVRQKPYSVVLLDEVEKAHPDVMNLFYQVFDKGELYDGEGKKINFRNTVIFLTTNLASEIIQNLTLNKKNVCADDVVEQIRPALSDHFKPALLARMNIVPFYGLGDEAIEKITALTLNKLKERLMEQNKIELDYQDEVISEIAERCRVVETGARNVQYILDNSILPRLSEKILIEMTTGNMPDKVFLKMGEDKSIDIEFS
ncbi:MAG: type VI secretion system ATPase TssH [Candidatus Cloacimonetes bacterium]|nr:type VI secretion system ATPase TssH [Candidatus Cloacimonadota bacterium]